MTELKMKKFRLLQGQHSHFIYDEKGKVSGRKDFKEGDVLEDSSDLVKKFPNKFQRVFDQQLAAEKEEKAEGFGDDVTNKFELAEENNLLVFKKGRSYFVTSDANPLVALNPLDRKMTTMPQVENWIEDYLENGSIGNDDE